MHGDIRAGVGPGQEVVCMGTSGQSLALGEKWCAWGTSGQGLALGKK